MELTLNSNYLPDNKVIDTSLYILEPLSVIIKLAILSNKPLGTKICIDKNVIYLQEPGPFQAICRYTLNVNKTDLQYLYNPIEFACKYYLTDVMTKQYPKLKELFKTAQFGIEKLMETYKHCSIMRLCLNYFYSIISNYFTNLEEKKFIASLFRKDTMTPLYTSDLIYSFEKIWSQDKIKIILNLTSFLCNDENAESNVKSLENIMDGIDKLVQTMLS